jgi:hypothetical protein
MKAESISGNGVTGHNTGENVMSDSSCRDGRLCTELSGFPLISSGEQDPIRFKRRYSEKYMISRVLFNQLLPGLAEHFGLFMLSGNKYQSVELTYYDTPDFRFFLDHVNGKYSRIKFRVRDQADTNSKVLEVYRRKNRGKIIKDRIIFTDWQHDIKGTHCLEPYFSDGLVPELFPVLNMKYERFSLLRNDFGERIIVDGSLEFNSPDYTLRDATFDHLIFLEVRRKREEKSLLQEMLKAGNVRTSNISKYCLGITRIRPGLKYNACKPVLRTIENINMESYV